MAGCMASNCTNPAPPFDRKPAHLRSIYTSLRALHLCWQPCECFSAVALPSLLLHLQMSLRVCCNTSALGTAGHANSCSLLLMCLLTHCTTTQTLLLPDLTNSIDTSASLVVQLSFALALRIWGVLAVFQGKLLEP